MQVYEPVHFDVRALPISSKRYRGEVYVLGQGEASILSWSPNCVKVAVNAEGILCLNQNYASGWHAKGGKIVRSHEGLLSIQVDRSDKVVTFYYLPLSFIFGAFITAFTSIGLVLTFLLKQKHF